MNDPKKRAHLRGSLQFMRLGLDALILLFYPELSRGWYRKAQAIRRALNDFIDAIDELEEK